MFVVDHEASVWYHGDARLCKFVLEMSFTDARLKPDNLRHLKDILRAVRCHHEANTYPVSHHSDGVICMTDRCPIGNQHCTLGLT